MSAAMPFLTTSLCPLFRLYVLWHCAMCQTVYTVTITGGPILGWSVGTAIKIYDDDGNNNNKKKNISENLCKGV